MNVQINLERDRYVTVYVHDVPKDVEIIIEKETSGRRIRLGTMEIVFFDKE